MGLRSEEHKDQKCPGQKKGFFSYHITLDLKQLFKLRNFFQSLHLEGNQLAAANFLLLSYNILNYTYTHATPCESIQKWIQLANKRCIESIRKVVTKKISPNELIVKAILKILDQIISLRFKLLIKR